MNHENVLDIKDLTWGYPGSPRLTFNHYSLSIKRGECCVIMGKSGSGKTSLLKVISGQVPVPEKMVYYKKEDIGRYSNHELQLWKRKLGIVTQHEVFIDYLSAKENITYPLMMYGVGDSIIQAKYEKIKQKYHTGETENIHVKALSAGEKAKVSIARALIHDPEILLIDEPTGNLDRENTQKFADMMIKMNQEGQTILISTHDIHLVNYLKEKHNIRLEILG